jgi:tRNA-dihydrouridine synthase 1
MTKSVDPASRAASPVPAISTDGNGHEASANDLPKKLHGRAFYKSIGSPKFILAPMVDQSEFVCLEFFLA